MNIVEQLEQLGQSIWYDNISRGLLRSGGLKRLVDQGLLGVTSNPTIFEKAIVGTEEYDGQVKELLALSPQPSTEDIIRSMMVRDIREATDVLRPVYDRTAGRDGYVSIEVTPSKARDTEATVGEARLLWELVSRPNLMIKIPATGEGLPAIRRSISDGININVTLIFSVERYREVADAYIGGLEDRLKAGKSIANIASVASVFVSRIDSLVDELLEKKIAEAPATGQDGLRSLLGKAAVANTKMVYQAFREIFAGERFAALRRSGATFQRPLWGSTSTKNPSYPDLVYVDSLIGPHTVNTVPPVTFDAILDHGTAALTVEDDLEGAREVLSDLAKAGIDVPWVMAKLESDGVSSFSRSFDGLYASIERKRGGA